MVPKVFVADAVLSLFYGLPEGFAIGFDEPSQGFGCVDLAVFGNEFLIFGFWHIGLFDF
jgi:hypothetical protein